MKQIRLIQPARPNTQIGQNEPMRQNILIILIRPITLIRWIRRIVPICHIRLIGPIGPIELILLISILNTRHTYVIGKTDKTD